MILRGFAIVLACLATWAIWLGYGQLRALRGTPLWEFRYLVMLIATFLGLGGVEWALGWLRRRLHAE